VVSSRRGGALATFDRLNKYFTISEMPVVSSQYWNEVHGSTPDEVRQDLEGLQIMRTLGKNMAWVLKNFENGRGVIPLPEQEPRLRTNFIR
jgi:multimeric flavodoxin WrbA